MKQIIIIAVIILPLKLYPVENTFKGHSEFSAKNILGFTNHLINKKEYYRAYVELMRLKSYYPRYISDEEYSVTEDYLLFQGKQFDRIREKPLLPRSTIAWNAGLIFRMDSFFQDMNFAEPLSFMSSWKWGSNAVPDDLLYKRKIFSYIMMRKSGELKKIFAENIKKRYSKYFELVNYSDDVYSKLKVPAAAAALGIIPGMGYMYAGESGTGIVAVIVVAVNAALTYYAFRTDNRAIGLFIGSIGTFFYGGNILGGYLAAKKYNRSTIEYMLENLGRKFEFEKDRDYLYMKYGTGRYVGKE